MNKLYPIFLKADQLKILIVGGGNVALEKLTFLLKSSPNANVSIVAREFNPKILELIKSKGLQTRKKSYDPKDLIGYSIVIGATDEEDTNARIYRNAKAQNILVNIADHPKLCDFYMGGIVTKGDLKLAISTNGKSPTMAKRLRQLFEAILPDSIDALLKNLYEYRNDLKGDFEHKVTEMNKMTQSIIDSKYNIK